MGQPPVSELSLASEFPPATREQWLELVDGVLRGRPFEQVLVSRLPDGIDVQPLYTAADLPAGADRRGLPGVAPYVRGSVPARLDWDVRVRHRVVDPAEANRAILADLERGATSLWLAVAPGDLDRALADVYLDLAPVILEPGPDPDGTARALRELWEARGVAPSAARGNLGADPLGTGGDLESAAELARRTAAELAGVRAMVVDAGIYHDAGAADAEELGCSMATAVAYLRALERAGLDPGAAADQLEFRYVGSADQFATIAKLRAARRLWARVTEACGAPRPQRQHVVTSSAMMTRRDPWVNMLRTTVATLAAAVAGADAVTVQPFDAAIGLSDELARRLARNTHAVLAEESHLAKVADPAGGSWYVERLTDELAGRAWAWFQDIERAGGMAAALDAGVVAERIEATWSDRERRLAHRRDLITGVSEYPDLAEAPLSRPAAPAPAWRPVPLRRHAAAFEALRDRSDRAPGRPRVFLANLGPIVAHSARASFATNLFAVAGIEAITNDGFDGPEDAAAAFTASGADIACICASDEEYERLAAPAAQALASAGARRVYLAGRHEAPGVDEHVYLGCDALDVLTRALDLLGVPQ